MNDFPNLDSLKDEHHVDTVGSSDSFHYSENLDQPMPPFTSQNEATFDLLDKTTLFDDSLQNDKMYESQQQQQPVRRSSALERRPSSSLLHSSNHSYPNEVKSETSLIEDDDVVDTTSIDRLTARIIHRDICTWIKDTHYVATPNEFQIFFKPLKISLIGFSMGSLFGKYIVTRFKNYLPRFISGYPWMSSIFFMGYPLGLAGIAYGTPGTVKSLLQEKSTLGSKARSIYHSLKNPVDKISPSQQSKSQRPVDKSSDTACPFNSNNIPSNNILQWSRFKSANNDKKLSNLTVEKPQTNTSFNSVNNLPFINTRPLSNDSYRSWNDIRQNSSDQSISNHKTFLCDENIKE